MFDENEPILRLLVSLKRFNVVVSKAERGYVASSVVSCARHASTRGVDGRLSSVWGCPVLLLLSRTSLQIRRECH